MGELAVRDGRTGLVWTVRDAGRSLSWDAAERWCPELARSSGVDWRLPTLEELATLYDEAKDQACGGDRCRIDPAIDLSTPYQWTRSQRGPRRRVYFDFRFGSELAPQPKPGLVRGVFCVRGSPSATSP